MQIVNPVFGRSASGGESLSNSAVDWSRDAIALFSNSKPNARELLDGIRDHFGAFRSTDNIDFVYKDSASQPAPAHLYDEVASRYKGALLAIAGANVAMILFGWLMETVNQPGRPVYWSPFWFGCIAGVGPWLAIIIAIGGGQSIDGAESPPSFVYGILVTIFLLFNCFAIVQWLQYRGSGRWADYVRGEVAYIVLSFVAKSALAWQIFANTLIPT